ncbi:Arylsulfatase [Posidoniimonas corsicana]|uniref:Arylsulfatase n=1 Tax=Posidoniimonas corsicana TaxID=1938618 RepID=A0A5C5VED2_9BACT|nr:sulfatase [Posidoniimonas corsicana]TWT36269.1 Arylsulfatase [Posidoniimonas corsicana]
MHRLCVASLLMLLAAAPCPGAERPPNVVVIFIDDMGYADIGPFGAEDYPTPHLDRMAAEGRVMTDFHAATAVCSASRAALLTGCYPERVGIAGALGPRARIGLHPDEVTIAELCRAQGFATACFGKWHLGDQPEFLPTRQGFDAWFGLPYSNDMWPQHPDLARLPADAAKRKSRYPNLPLYEGEQIIDDEVTAEDQAQLTTQYTERAVEFIDQHADRPFFLYLPHTMVHVPLFVSDKFHGKSGAGLFGDVAMELDWSVGQVLDALQRNGVDQNTLVVFTSDNGPWLSYGDHAGSAGPLREGKGTMFEGGYRVPCVVRWPGRIPAGSSCDELASTMDLLPTIAALIGAEPPADRTIDGRDIWPLLSGESGALSPHQEFYCYYGRELRAVRDRRWKLHLRHRYRTLSGRPGGTGGTPVGYDHTTIGLELFDLKSDPGETTNVAGEHPDVVERLQAAAQQAREALGDTLTKTQGSEVRPPGRVERAGK